MSNIICLLLWSLFYCIKAQVGNPYTISLANVTLQPPDRAEVIVKVINTNPSFQSSTVSLILSLSNESYSQTLLNISSLPTQVRQVDKVIENLTQDREYTVTLSVSQSDSSTPLQSTIRSITFMTTNIQSISINDDPDDCRLTVYCEFALQSQANGCTVLIGELDVNNTNITSTEVLIQRMRRSLVSSIDITGDQYQSLTRDEVYTVEGYGTIDGQRIDTIESDSVIELTGQVAVNRCQVTTGGSQFSKLLIIFPIVVLITIITFLILLVVTCLVIRQQRRRREIKKVQDSVKNYPNLCSSCVLHEESSGIEERESPRPEYIEVLPDKQSSQATPTPSQSSVEEEEEEEEEEESTYENVGISYSHRSHGLLKQPENKATPTGLVITKKVQSPKERCTPPVRCEEERGGAHSLPPPPLPPHLSKDNDVKRSPNGLTQKSHQVQLQRKSMPAIVNEEDEEDEYIDMIRALPSVDIKRNKAYNSMETIHT